MTGLEIAQTTDIYPMTKEELQQHVDWLERRIKYCRREDLQYTADLYEAYLSEAKQKLEEYGNIDS